MVVDKSTISWAIQDCPGCGQMLKSIHVYSRHVDVYQVSLDREANVIYSFQQNLRDELTHPVATCGLCDHVVEVPLARADTLYAPIA